MGLFGFGKKKGLSTQGFSEKDKYRAEAARYERLQRESAELSMLRNRASQAKAKYRGSQRSAFGDFAGAVGRGFDSLAKGAAQAQKGRKKRRNDIFGGNDFF